MGGEGGLGRQRIVNTGRLRPEQRRSYIASIPYDKWLGGGAATYGVRDEEAEHFAPLLRC